MRVGSMYLLRGDRVLRYAGDGPTGWPRFQSFDSSDTLCVDPADVISEVDERAIVKFGYTNYKGERSERTVLPLRIEFGATEHYPEPQWLMHAFDFSKCAVRTFRVNLGAQL